jgi:two-component system chemotaxis response regulator CheB
MIVIGGSAGALPALKKISSGLVLPQTAVFVVIHFPGDKISRLPEILNKAGSMTAVHAKNNEVISHGKIYIAPPDFHMIVSKGKIFLSSGPKENGFRPSVDVLFRSAALAYKSDVTGIILSGAMDDGTAGLMAVKEAHGTSIVQDPDEAIVSGMPGNALKYVPVDYCMPASEIHMLLKDTSFINKQVKKHKSVKNNIILEWENEIALGKSTDMATIKRYADSTRYICPLCEGPLFRMKNGKIPRYRCFIGHAFSAETLLNKTSEKIEHLLWTAYRTLDEKKEMLQNIVVSKSELKQMEKEIDDQLTKLNRLIKENERPD